MIKGRITNMSDKAYMVPNPPTPNKAVEFNPDICIGCNLCVDVCPGDVMMPNPEKKKQPILPRPTRGRRPDKDKKMPQGAMGVRPKSRCIPCPRICYHLYCKAEKCYNIIV